MFYIFENKLTKPTSISDIFETSSNHCSLLTTESAIKMKEHPDVFFFPAFPHIRPHVTRRDVGVIYEHRIITEAARHCHLSTVTSVSALILTITMYWHTLGPDNASGSCSLRREVGGCGYKAEETRINFPIASPNYFN